MATLKVIDLSGKELGTVDVSDEVFAQEVKEHLLWEAVRAQRSARRARTASVKERGEVRMTKAKIWKQKGTGNARHGSRRANIFRGGGVVHGPRMGGRVVGMNKKAMAGALKSALSLRAKEGAIVVVREITGPEPKTKALASALNGLDAPKSLLVDNNDNHWLRLSSRNLPTASFLDERGLNVYDILRFPKLVISEASLKAVESRLTGADKAGAA